MIPSAAIVYKIQKPQVFHHTWLCHWYKNSSHICFHFSLNGGIQEEKSLCCLFLRCPVVIKRIPMWSYSGQPKTESGWSFSRWICRTSHRLHSVHQSGAACVFVVFFLFFMRKEHLCVLKASPNVFMLIHSVTGLPNGNSEHKRSTRPRG